MGDKYQYCAECKGSGAEAFEPEAGRVLSLACPVCDGEGVVWRTGPYRLADGTWSDGIDRSKRINKRVTPLNRFEVYRFSENRWVAFAVSQRVMPNVYAEFPTHAEAIAHADTHARTTKNGAAT